MVKQKSLSSLIQLKAMENEETSSSVELEQLRIMEIERGERIDRRDAYRTIQNMIAMLVEAQMDGAPVVVHKSLFASKRIRKRYGIRIQSYAMPIWVVLEKIVNGEYELKKKP